MQISIQLRAIVAHVVTLGVMVAIMHTQAIGAAAQSLDASLVSPVVVRTYDYFGGPVGDLRAPRIDAETILRQAGIEITWVDCRFSSSEHVEISPRCHEPLSANELVLRVMAAHDTGGRSSIALGSSIIDRKIGSGFLATVFVDRIVALAREATVDPQVVLGRAIAHEIGHLLLNTTRHADSGLMRALWSHAELQRNQATDWLFRDDEARAMQTALAFRLTHRDATAP